MNSEDLSERLWRFAARVGKAGPICNLQFSIFNFNSPMFALLLHQRWFRTCTCAALLVSGLAPLPLGGQPVPASSSTWPQPYSVQRDEARGVLALRTSFYTVEHDLKQGGAISRIALTHGRAANLLARPIETRVRDQSGAVLSNLKAPAPAVTHARDGLHEVVTVECALADEQGRASALRVKTTFDYRWGYVRVHKEFLVPGGGFRALEVCPVSTVLAPGLTDYGYREGTTEEEGAPPFAFGSNLWGRSRPGQSAEPAIQARYIPRSMIFADPGVEGLEWFAASDLSQWDLQLTGRRGQGRCLLGPSRQPPGLALSLAPLWSTNGAVSLPRACVFDFYFAVPLIEGHALKPWLHTSFNRNQGNWVSPEQIRLWRDQGYQTVHCHNDGDYYNDGLFWRDGSYPPYPDMDRYDQALRECRRAGIRTATYFSNKELHPSTREFQEHGPAWGRMNRKGGLQHNFYRPQSEFGAQMCLRSGWLDFLKLSIDRVLKNSPLDGVYYDWNVALLCCNPLHEGRSGANAPAQGHWDIDELLNLMEWTRQRVGPAASSSSTTPPRRCSPPRTSPTTWWRPSGATGNGPTAPRRFRTCRWNGRWQARAPGASSATAPSTARRLAACTGSSPSRRSWAGWPHGPPARRPSTCSRA